MVSLKIVLPMLISYLLSISTHLINGWVRVSGLGKACRNFMMVKTFQATYCKPKGRGAVPHDGDS